MNNQNNPSAAECAAKTYAEGVIGQAIDELKKAYGGEYTPDEDAIALVEKYFLAGADWHHNSIWNTVNVPPKKGYDIVCISREGHFFSSFFALTDKNWLEVSSRSNVLLWAYKQDILPALFYTIK